MKAVKGKKTKNFTVSSKTMTVDPPKGYHWMEEGGRYYLMAGDYKPHPGAVAKAKFKMADHPKKKYWQRTQHNKPPLPLP